MSRAINLDGVPDQPKKPTLTDWVTAAQVALDIDEWKANKHDAWSTDQHVEATNSIVAIMRTADGAEKLMMVPYPPRPAYKTCIQTRSPLIDVTCYGDGTNQFVTGATSYVTREYVFKSMDRDVQRRLMRCIYEERV
jgi:hypothetical protein